MKYFLLVLYLVIGSLNASSQQNNAKDTMPGKNKEILVVDAACGQCLFEMEGKDCDLAVKINGKVYYVDGTHIDNHGDAHADDGFCNAVKKARVQGEIVNGRFKASYFKLMDTSKKPKTIQ